MKQTNKVALSCENCCRKNYYTNKSLGIEKRLIVKKFCVHCGQHTTHKEEV
ncbi:50S ribosomal protein L33 [Mycoplasmopsis cynos]|uniref:50S ribosomal protein L33 n=1 Tax=Mycoplasmopsis cynos TaxID=171284 RepID=UPI0021FA478F|nr:50S ribosomal protein L33 [Mycoplasmopsis cynos]MCU9936110.1 50S ribosomal protein L33 [Mycoplasmopsis cynos]UWV81625.1 50S ribosomal protein L33 [Mycoplasmopsis cynos]WAM04342.1 50S ribosomal protein L33 [Mycoplasmopsis cynos]WAM07842.1 50S ribosomal protein L33 [Mycoplasmopsis cynos]WAM09871.1 50S ribosomal protein L33 [Mycoplasmopsis cynos]